MKRGFTLAEVLITLGIIGVVTALTIPVLISLYQKNVLRNQFKAAYSTIQEAWRKAESDLDYRPSCYYWLKSPYKGVCQEKDEYGSCTKFTLEDGSPLPSDFNGNFTECKVLRDAVLENMKIIKTCKNNAYKNGCIPAYKGIDTVMQANRPEDNQMSDDEAASKSRGCGNFREKAIRNDRSAYVLANGIIFIPYDSTNGVHIFAIDINGMKGPNKWGHDLFTFMTRADVNSPLRLTPDGCMNVEKGGLSTSQMLRDIYK